MDDITAALVVQVINVIIPVVVTGILGFGFKTWNAFVKAKKEEVEQNKLASEIWTNLQVQEATQTRITEAATDAVKAIVELNRQNKKNTSTTNFSPAGLHSMAFDKAQKQLERVGIKVTSEIADQLHDKILSKVPEIRTTLETD